MSGGLSSFFSFSTLLLSCQEDCPPSSHLALSFFQHPSNVLIIGILEDMKIVLLILEQGYMPMAVTSYVQREAAGRWVLI
eukprot:scaffold6549_cov61-Cyclotella_meneghiniana.AAC.2